MNKIVFYYEYELAENTWLPRHVSVIRNRDIIGRKILFLFYLQVEKQPCKQETRYNKKP